MVGNYQRKLVNLVLVYPAAKLRQTLIRFQQCLCREAAHRHNNFRLDKGNLLVKIRTTLLNFTPERVTVVRRTALKYVSDVNLITR